MRKGWMLAIALFPYIVSFIFLYLWKLFPIYETSQSIAFIEFWTTIPIFVMVIYVPLWLGAGILFQKKFQLSFKKSFFVANGLGILSLLFGLFYYNIVGKTVGYNYGVTKDYISFACDFFSNAYWSQALVIGNLYTGTIFAMLLFTFGYFLSAKEFSKKDIDK